MKVAEKSVEVESADKTCCPVEVKLPAEAPLTLELAGELEDLFKVLANDTRLRMLHSLMRVKEMCVCDLATGMGMTPQAVSNQLQRLVDRGIVAGRRQGNMIYYRVVDDCVVDLLHQAMCLLADSKEKRRTGP